MHDTPTVKHSETTNTRLVDPRFRQGTDDDVEPDVRLCGAFRRILLPVWRGVSHEVLVDHAAQLAVACGADLMVMRVLDPRAGDAPGYVDEVEWALAKAQAQRELQGIVDSLRKFRVRVEPRLLEGAVADQVARFVSANGVDLIVLPCIGGLAGDVCYLPTAAHELMRSCLASFLVVPSGMDRPAWPGAQPRVMVPLDCSARGEVALATALALAGALAAEVLLVHVVPELELPRRLAPSCRDVELADALTSRNKLAAGNYLRDIQADVARQGLGCRYRVVAGVHVARTLSKLAAEESIDVMVISAHGRSGRMSEPFGNVAEALPTRVPCPTLIVQDGAAHPHVNSSTSTAGFR